MKNHFKSWKLWTVLSVLSFVMTLSLVAYAASSLSTSSSFTSWKTTSMWNTLSADDWNTLMDKLEAVSVVSVPKWAIMAFNSYNCPNGWSPFEAAEWWRTLVWEGGNFRLGSTGWSGKITLNEHQLPPHSHKLFSLDSYYNNYAVEMGSDTRLDSQHAPAYFVQYSQWWYEDVSNNIFSYAIKNGKYDASLWKSSTVWNWWEIDIMNPYVVVKYCVKD